MNKLISKQKRYLQKIRNDIDENMFDLLATHLIELSTKIKLYDEDKIEMIKLLDLAIKKLQERITEFNKLFIHRHILICANKLLLLDKSRKDITQLKKDIIADFNHKEAEEGYIPLNDQITEVRITYDTSYLIYLLKKLFDKDQEYNKALFCFEAIKLIEPDNDVIDLYQEKFDELFPLVELSNNKYEEPKNMLLILDSNIILSRVLKDIKGFENHCNETFDLEKLGNNNKFVILPSVIKEVDKNIYIRCLELEKNKSKGRELKETLMKKIKKTIEKYSCNHKFDKKEVEDIISDILNKIYINNISKLRTIFEQKVSKEGSLSHKLRKMTKRNELLPEQGDLELLSYAILLKNKTNEKIGILSNDIDFQAFSKEIKEEFDINIP